MKRTEANQVRRWNKQMQSTSAQGYLGLSCNHPEIVTWFRGLAVARSLRGSNRCPNFRTQLCHALRKVFAIPRAPLPSQTSLPQTSMSLLYAIPFGLMSLVSA
jgi:hypothetical protein